MLYEVDLCLIQILIKHICPKILPLRSLAMEEIFERIASLALLPLIIGCVMMATSIGLEAAFQT